MFRAAFHRAWPRPAAHRTKESSGRTSVNPDKYHSIMLPFRPGQSLAMAQDNASQATVSHVSLKCGQNLVITDERCWFYRSKKV